MRMSSLICWTALFFCFSTALPGQGTEESATGSGSETRSPRSKGEVRKGEKGDRGEKGEEGEGGGEENLTPEERLARNITSGAAAFCRFQAALKPAKLLPGQTGTLLVTAILQGQAVLPSPPPFEVTSVQQQGVVTVGGLLVRPAENGRLAAAYLGRPVYDNYAVFELPVTLSAEAQLGKRYPVVVDFKFDLYDGATGLPLQRFLDRVTTEVEVGIVADPVVRASNRPVANATTTNLTPAEAVAVEPAAKTPAPREVRGDTIIASDPTPVAASVPSADGVGSLPVGEEGGGDFVLFAVGGGILLVLVVLLLARRK